MAGEIFRGFWMIVGSIVLLVIAWFAFWSLFESKPEYKVVTPEERAASLARARQHGIDHMINERGVPPEEAEKYMEQFEATREWPMELKLRYPRKSVPTG